MVLLLPTTAWSSDAPVFDNSAPAFEAICGGDGYVSRKAVVAVGEVIAAMNTVPFFRKAQHNYCFT